MDDARMPTTKGTELIDRLEQVLIAQFGLRSALEHAQALLCDETLALARQRVTKARAERGQAITGEATLAEISAAGERERAAEQLVEQIEGWRAHKGGEEHLAVEVFTGARARRGPRSPLARARCAALSTGPHPPLS